MLIMQIAAAGHSNSPNNFLIIDELWEKMGNMSIRDIPYSAEEKRSFQLTAIKAITDMM